MFLKGAQVEHFFASVSNSILKFYHLIFKFYNFMDIFICTTLSKINKSNSVYLWFVKISSKSQGQYFVLLYIIQNISPEQFWETTSMIKSN